MSYLKRVIFVQVINLKTAGANGVIYILKVFIRINGKQEEKSKEKEEKTVSKDFVYSSAGSSIHIKLNV
jgi:hypothetical protein